MEQPPMDKILWFLSLPIFFVDWVWSWTVVPLGNKWNAIDQISRIYIAMFLGLMYVEHLINRTRRDFYKILTEEQKKEFHRVDYFETKPTDYITGCLYFFGFFSLLYYIYKGIIWVLAYLFG